MACWRCGNPTVAGENECVKCQQGEENEQRAIHEIGSRPSALIDWDRVETLDDIKIIFDAIGFTVYKDTPLYDKLRRFLRE